MTIGLLIFSDPSMEQFTGADRFEIAARERGHDLVKIYEPYLSFEQDLPQSPLRKG